MHLAAALARHPEAQVTVLTSSAVGEIPAAPRLRVLPVMRDWGLREAVRLARVLRAERPDVVHVQYPTQGYGPGRLANLVPLIARLAGPAVVQTWHEPMTLRELRQRLLVRSQLIIVRANLASMLPAPARHLLQGRTLHHVAGASSLPVASLEPSEREDLRRRYLDGQRRLVVFFGFIYPNKGVEHLFELADPSIDRIVVAGEWGVDSAYRNRLETLAQGKWSGKATFTGFLTPEQAAMLLAVADAVVLPFREGGGDWNSSILGATANGAYVITTSKERRGYDEGRNIAFTAIDDVAEMRKALALSETRGARAGRSPGRPAASGWDAVAARHLDVYRRALETEAHHPTPPELPARPLSHVSEHTDGFSSEGDRR